ncbi:MAG: TetR/AcrR family transcriptional regulator [Myxococcota bacterium]
MTRERSSRQTRKPRGSALRRRVREGRKSVYREAISAAAERVFAAKGTDGSRMAEIAAEAGVSLGTLYAVVEGKASLFRDVQRMRMREFLACIRAARDAHEDTLARQLAVLREGARYFLERPDFLRLSCRRGYAWATRVGDADDIDLWDEGVSIPRDLFADGIAEGAYVEDDPGLLARKMLALKQVELTHWLDGGMETPHETVLDRLEDQFLRAFCVRDPRA